jgi:hypothetical protein
MPWNGLSPSTLLRADVSCMDLFPRSLRMRAFHGCLRRALAGAVGAGLLVLAIPVPSMAAPTPSVTITDVTITEGTGGTVDANFTIQAAPAPRFCCAVQVSWATAPGSATAPADFTASSGTVSLTKTSASKVVSVPVVGDALNEANETFVVNLSNLVGSPGTIGDAQGVAIITDNDPIPVLSVNDVSVTEGNAGTTTATFTITLSAASGRAVTFDWVSAAGSATSGTDYVAASGSRTIAAGGTTAAVGITVNGDVADEFDETFGITLSNPGNATIGDGSGVATITDDDPVPVLSVNDVSVTEGNAGTSTAATFTVTLSAASGKTVTVDWATANGSATSPSDFTAGSGTLTFVPGDTSESIAVAVNGDITAELDETYGITLSNPGNATIADGSGLGTITDDELLPVIHIDDPTLAEGQSGMSSVSFPVKLSNPAAFPVSVDWTTTAGTATSGTDYLGASGTVTFAPLDVSETVQVTVYGDGTYEGDETFGVDLSNASGAPIGDMDAIATIVNDDDAPIISVGNISKTEGNTGTSLLTFAISLVGDSDVNATFDWATADATATAGTDYVAGSGTLTIPAGTTSGTVSVVVNGDVAYEPNETLSLTLTNPASATIGDGVALGTITNDDKRPTTLTLQVVRKPRAVVAKGILEPTASGQRVTATLFRKQGGKFVKIAAKTVVLRYLKDRDGDGKTDGSYNVTFTRPKAKGSYRILARFKGGAAYKPCNRAKLFSLTAS